MASSSRRKYDAFISFRGEDTRYNFLSHLHKALLQKRIETYVDERLERGDEISPALLKAIEESEVSVIIFSENYASSSWCLDELVHIMIGCKERNVVVPIFYHVTPSEVRKQSGRFGDAFAKLVERSKDKEELWRTALTMAANLSGWDAPINSEDYAVVTSKFQPYFLQAATEFRSNHEEQDEETKCPGISFCHPGSKIPKWFNHQSERSSMDLSFSRDWYNTGFLGFAVCIVVEFRHFYMLYDLNFTCEYHFKTNRGDSTFQKSRDVHSMRKLNFNISDHMFIWYVLYKDYLYYHEAIEASFQFFVEQLDSKTLVKVGDLKIKNCGIRVLCRQDIEEFCYNQVAAGELDIVDNINCDTNEPHPKRTKFQDFRN